MEGKQTEIGQDGAVVPVPVKEYEELLMFKKLATDNVCIPVQEYERLMQISDLYYEATK